jgi:formylglycine-generating enzyme required for sulfatase activity
VGSDPDIEWQIYDDEKPQWSETFAAFQIGKYPVTVAEYARFVRIGQKSPQDWQQQLGKLDHPDVDVSRRVAFA